MLSKPRVVLVGHGMGGLVGRAYIQGLGVTAAGTKIGYASVVTGVITLGTPHGGSDLSSTPGDWDAACAASDSVNRQEMRPAVGHAARRDCLVPGASSSRPARRPSRSAT